MSQEEFAVEGLSSTASIVVDRWGIAHVRAESFLDMFFVQGFNAARDRLWQIDLWRKRGLGVLAADFGPGYLEQDRAARLFLYRGDMQAEWDAYAEASRIGWTMARFGTPDACELRQRRRTAAAPTNRPDTLRTPTGHRFRSGAENSRQDVHVSLAGFADAD